jgi:hypothetical protein
VQGQRVLSCMRAFAGEVSGHRAGAGALATLPSTSVSNKFLTRTLEVMEFDSWLEVIKGAWDLIDRLARDTLDTLVLCLVEGRELP